MAEQMEETWRLRRLAGAYQITFAMIWVHVLQSLRQHGIAVSIGLILTASILQALRYRLK